MVIKVDNVLKRNVENFIGCDASFEEASIVIFGAPFDSTTSYRPGARFGSAAMRHESFGLETYSPYQDKDAMDKIKCDELHKEFMKDFNVN